MKLRILEPALLEIEDSVAYCNRECPGLGFEFADEVFQTFERVRMNPDAWAPLSQRARRCKTRRFPFGVIYQVRGEFIVVVAVMHLKRHPDAWKDRLGNGT